MSCLSPDISAGSACCVHAHLLWTIFSCVLIINGPHARPCAHYLLDLPFLCLVHYIRFPSFLGLYIGVGAHTCFLEGEQMFILISGWTSCTAITITTDFRTFTFVFRGEVGSHLVVLWDVCTEITPGGFQGPYSGLEIILGLAACKACTFFSYPLLAHD